MHTWQTIFSESGTYRYGATETEVNRINLSAKHITLLSHLSFHFKRKNKDASQTRTFLFAMGWEKTAAFEITTTSRLETLRSNRFPLQMFGMNVNWSSLPVTAGFYALHMIGWLDRCMNAQVFLLKWSASVYTYSKNHLSVMQYTNMWLKTAASKPTFPSPLQYRFLNIRFKSPGFAFHTKELFKAGFSFI